MGRAGGFSEAFVLAEQRMQGGRDSGVGSPAFCFVEAFLLILLLPCLPGCLWFVYVCAHVCVCGAC